jgi:hypothetical protein
MARVSEERAFARALMARREAINAQFVLARREHRRLDGEAYMEALARWGGPVVDAAAALEPARAEAVCAAVAEATLELVARGYMGEHTRTPQVHVLWEQVLPALGRFVAAQPQAIIHAMTNAVIALSAAPQVRVSDWIGWMVALSSRCADGAELLGVGKVLAWRVGMAHWRASALAVAAELPQGLVMAALGLRDADAAGTDTARLLEVLGRYPWRRPYAVGKAPVEYPLTQLKIMHSVGGFRGFGGVFMQPPQVAATPDGQLYAYTQDGCWSLHADCFGATLQRHGKELPDGIDQAPGEFKLTPNGRVSLGKLRTQLPQLMHWYSTACNEHMMAVTLWHSHKIFIIAAI